MPIHRLDDLAHLIEQPPHVSGQLGTLIGSGQSQQANPIALPQRLGQFGADVALIANHRHLWVRWQQIARCVAVVGVGTCQLEIDNRAAQRDQQMLAIAVDGALFGRTLTKAGALRRPVASG